MSRPRRKPTRTLESALSESERRAFFDIGWIVRRGVFETHEIARMRRCFDALERNASSMTATSLRSGSYFVLGRHNGKQVIKRVVWAGGSQRYLLEIGKDSRLTVPSAQLLGTRSMEQLLCQAHFKHPFDGVTFGWHQDIEHRDKGAGTWVDVNGRGSFVQTLIALDSMDADSGPLQFVEGSARWGRIDFTEDWYDRHIARADADDEPRHAIRTIAAQPGDVLFFGPYAVHASFENTSDHPRRVLINGFACPGANGRCYPGAGIGRRLTAPVRIDTPTVERAAVLE